MTTNTQDYVDYDIDVREPSLYAVIIHNDHITTMDFVTEVLMKVFKKTPQEAASLMMEVHEAGHGVAGVYVYDIAATKKAQTDMLSAERGFPLKTTLMEEEQ